VARQPVFNRRFDVIGYELLFRPTKHALSTGRADDRLQGDLMTAQVLFNSVEIGVDRLAGDRLLFCNASRGTLVGDIPLVLPPERTVIEVLESVVIDQEVLDGCAHLVDQGYTLALDDFTWFDGAERLLQMASIVKVDLMLVAPEDLPELLERCAGYGVTLLAEKIEDREQLHHCEALGFEYFQGYLLSRPQIVQGRGHRLEGSRLAVLRIAEHLWDPDARIDTIERFVRADPALCVQILKVASIGSAHGMRRTVRSLYEALVLVGSRRLQAWVTLMLVMGHDTAPEETLSTALVRARLCELLAEQIEPRLGDEGFATGLLSCLDLLLGVPVADALGELNIDDEVEAAILRHEGALGAVLMEALFLQTGEYIPGRRTGIDTSIFQVSYVEAVAWADEMVHSLFGSGSEEPPAMAAPTRRFKAHRG
jgi:EAL and modified HD-GYP domain-containing signal transduction protein